MRSLKMGRLLTSLAAVALAAVSMLPTAAAATAGGVAWQTGMRSVGAGATVEPAVNDVTGAQTFLITPNHSPFWSVAAHPPGTPIPANLAKTSAPLYRVTDPLQSTVDTAAPLNCYTEGAFDPTGVLPQGRGKVACWGFDLQVCGAVRGVACVTGVV